MSFYERISQYKFLFCTVLIITFIVGFFTPVFQANVEFTQALVLEKLLMYEKIGAISDSIHSLELAIDKPDEFQSAKDSLRIAWQDMQSQFSAEYSRLEALNMDPIILDRYTNFIQHYERQILILNSRVDSFIANHGNAEELALLQEQLKEFSKNPTKVRVENPTPFQIEKHQTLRKLSMAQL